MPPDGFLRDEWFIAIISLLIVPITEVLVRKVRSIFGIYSGQYAALTYSEGSGKVLVEDVRCRHIGDSLRGTIRGVAVLDISREGCPVVSVNTGEYRFSGWINRDVFVVSYRSANPRVAAEGTLTMRSDGMGRAVVGRWSGAERYNIVSGDCAWIRVSPPISVRKHEDRFLEVARSWASRKSAHDLDDPYGLSLFKVDPDRRIVDRFNWLSRPSGRRARTRH